MLHSRGMLVQGAGGHPNGMILDTQALTWTKVENIQEAGGPRMLYGSADILWHNQVCAS